VCKLTVEEEHYVQPLMKERDAIISAMPTEDVNEDDADNGSLANYAASLEMMAQSVGGGTLC
jgi:hypothetical protein